MTAKAGISNWGGNLKFRPVEVLYPTSEEEVCAIVRRAKEEGKKVRVVGSGHSWTPLIEAEQAVLVNMDDYSGIVSFDSANCRANIRAGTKLKHIGPALWDHQMAMENMGDIDSQTIAGAISTGTHGSGIKLQSIPNTLTSLRIVVASGEVIHVSREADPRLFKACAISLGALGIITEVQLQCVPIFNLRCDLSKRKPEEVLDNLRALVEQHRSFEFFFFPYGDAVLVKTLNEAPVDHTSVTAKCRKLDNFVENVSLEIISKYLSKQPESCETLSKLISSSVTCSCFTDRSYGAFVTARTVKFLEMEYSVPYENAVDCVRQMRKAIQNERFQVHFPIEVRFVKGDDLFLSPAYGRDSCYIAVHCYKEQEYKAYFDHMEQILLMCGGRPHWGKMNTLTGADFQDIYPQWHEFCSVKAALDPSCLFCNPYLCELFKEHEPRPRRSTTGPDMAYER